MIADEPVLPKAIVHVAAFALALRCLGDAISRVLAAKASGANGAAVQAYGVCASLYREAQDVLGGLCSRSRGDSGIPSYSRDAVGPESLTMAELQKRQQPIQQR